MQYMAIGKIIGSGGKISVHAAKYCKIERESRSDSDSGDENDPSSEPSPQPPMPFTAPEEPISHA